MYLLDNPVLQRELLVNLRMGRAFVLLAAYVGLLGVVVYTAWPSAKWLDLTAHSAAETSPGNSRLVQREVRSEEATQLVNMFFLGQYVLMSLMAPSFAAGAISGEKERKTYEMLLASPMRPGAIVVGKLLASLCHLAVLVFCSLPIVMLCLPLGGVSPYEVLATYVAMAASVVTFGMISLTLSGYFARTVPALVVSYLLILPLALVGVVFYNAFAQWAEFRLVMLVIFFPGACLALCAGLMSITGRRLLYPPDVGSEAQEVVDLDQEQKTAVGMVIRSDQFPDMLFAPPKRTEPMADSVNPVLDKEIRSELFGQGTLMLRLVIQLSMGLALFLMAICLYISPQLAPWYTSYVLLFNMLVGPVFSAGSVTNERERQTLELLLTTTLSPWKILWGKLFSGLRVSTVLTSFLVWPILLAWVLPPWPYWKDTTTLLVGYPAIILLTSLTTTTLALFCSVVSRKTSVSMMTAYVMVILLFAVPVAVNVFADIFFPARAAKVLTEPNGQITHAARFRLSGGSGSADFKINPGDSLTGVANRINAKTAGTGVTAFAEGNNLSIAGAGKDPSASVGLELLSGAFEARTPAAVWLRRLAFTSPFAASFSLPLKLDKDEPAIEPNWPVFFGFLGFYIALNASLLWAIVWLFNVRWRVVQ